MKKRTIEEQRKIDIGRAINKSILAKGKKINDEKSGRVKPKKKVYI